MRLLKTAGVTLLVAAVTAGSVVWYIDYKINQMAEAVMAPVRETTETVGETIDEIEESVDVAKDAVDTTFETTKEQIANDLEKARGAVEYEIERARDLHTTVEQWVDSLASGQPSAVLD